MCAPAHAALIDLSYDFLNQVAIESDPGSGVDKRGNVLQFVDDGFVVEVSSWADSNTGFINQAATAVQMEFGLGSCNVRDGTLARCLDGMNAANKSSIDNGGGYDWVLLLFPETVDFGSVTVTPAGDQHMDITYWAGTIGDSSAISGLSYAELDNLFGPRVTADFGKSELSQTVVIVDDQGIPVSGNAILIGTSLTRGADRFAISGLSATAVPLPAPMLLMLSALGLLALVRVRRVAGAA
jgi:hypothetical protein